MKNIFKAGDTKTFIRKVGEADVARFDDGMVHPVYATFNLARDAEWCGRLFVLDMKEPHEEGIGTLITVEHIAPARLGEEVALTATIKSINKNEIICVFDARVGSRLIAKGEQRQKILSKEKLEHIFAAL